MRVSAEKILEVAIGLFSSHSYHGTSVADIMKKAGVSKSLFYHYFKSKEDILTVFARTRLGEWDPLVTYLEGEEDPMKRVSFLVDFVLSELERAPARLRFILSLYLNTEGVKAIEKALKKYRPLFERLFQEEKRLFTDLQFTDPEDEATFLRSMLQGITLEYLLSPKDYPLEAMKKKILNRYIP